MADDRVQEIADPLFSLCRNRKRFSNAQIIKLIHIHLLALVIIHFIDSKNHRAATLSQHIRHLRIRVCHSLPDIRDKNNHIRRINGDLRLFPHLGKDDILAVRFNSSGINNGKISVQPGNICINAVPGHTRRILYNGYHLAGQRVKQGRFPYIRSPHNSHNRLAHSFASFYDSVRFPLPAKLLQMPARTDPQPGPVPPVLFPPVIP